ncbi:MAG TPA: helicase-related protein [Chloroflexota bacterium]|nr:helicase-related protein [Chloroflexota bacterium]
MPQIFDNIKAQLLPELRKALAASYRADFCVGYFNLRGWGLVSDLVDEWQGGDGACCRVLVGMQRLPQDELRTALSLVHDDGTLDNATATRLKKQMAEEFRHQLTIGAPTNKDEAALRCLAEQLRAKKVVVKLFLKHPLHAKLYLLYRHDPLNPKPSYLGSSNLTLSGLSFQGELNIDVPDHDAADKLEKWFNDRWTDHWCLDISDELAAILAESWAREDLIPPYHVYLKMAYHLCRDAREGVSEFQIPRDFGNRLFDYQVAAVKIASQHLNKQGGVLIGDVVGLGKTLMATAVARIFQDDQGTEALILCPKNLVPMWEDYVHQYRLLARVLSITRVETELPKLRRYRLVVIDESHNLRNREGVRYRAIQDYITKNDSRCVLLSATPFNKSYRDLSAQLRLFVQEQRDLGIRPETLVNELGETEFVRRHQCPPRSLAAFEKSEYADDWRELMRLFMVRRTRSFIKQHYADVDEDGRHYLTLESGERSHFPTRVPKRAAYKVDPTDANDQYARLCSDDVVALVNSLELPRYGLGNYIEPTPHTPPKPAEASQLNNLSRAGKRLMGFCRTNLFKRLESDGDAFVQSLQRHVLRNFVWLYAVEHERDLPLGTQDPEFLDSAVSDEDGDATLPGLGADDDARDPNLEDAGHLKTEADYRVRAAQVYEDYATHGKRHFRWVRPSLFTPALGADLLEDARKLIQLMERSGPWDHKQDAKLGALEQLLTKTHPGEKVLVFTQFADTVNYLVSHLSHIPALAGVTGATADPTEIAYRFSPASNERRDKVAPKDELRVLVTTDVLSDGQNLQDCSVIVNFDLPWAIIRLVQRAGRVDRIGQHAEEVRCYSFLPSDGVDRIIRLRRRVRERLRQNAEVVGTDERFFEDEEGHALIDIYNEKAGILDDDEDNEVDLASYAYQIWHDAITAAPPLEKLVKELPPVVYSAKSHPNLPDEPEGVLIYTRTGQGNDALAWVDSDGNPVTQSQLKILRAAACTPKTPALAKAEEHHALVLKGVQHLLEEDKGVGGQLGRPSGARFRAYERMKDYVSSIKGTLFDSEKLERTIEEIYRFPLLQSAADAINRQMRGGITNERLAELLIDLREDNRLCLVEQDAQEQEPQIICSMGLRAEMKG